MDENKELPESSLSAKDLEKLYRYCLTTNDRDVAIDMAMYTDAIDKIIKSGNPKWNYRTARDVVGTPIRAHGMVVIASEDPELNFFFAKIMHADIPAHAEVVIKHGKMGLNRKFAKIDGVDFKEHMQRYLNYQGRQEADHDVQPETKTTPKKTIKTKHPQNLIDDWEERAEKIMDPDQKELSADKAVLFAQKREYSAMKAKCSAMRVEYLKEKKAFLKKQEIYRKKNDNDKET